MEAALNATRKPKTQPETETAVPEQTDFRQRKTGYDAQDSFEHGERFRSSRSQWNSSFFAFPLIIEGITEKALQFIMPLKSIYNQNLVSLNKKMYF
jgi:hypothetical protein